MIPGISFLGLRAFRTDVASALIHIAQQAGIDPRHAWGMTLEEFLRELQKSRERGRS